MTVCLYLCMLETLVALKGFEYDGDQFLPEDSVVSVAPASDQSLKALLHVIYLFRLILI